MENSSENAQKDKSSTVNLREEPGKSKDLQVAELMLGGIINSAVIAKDFVNLTDPPNLTDYISILKGKADNLHKGDLRYAETLLISQAAALDAIFCTMSSHAKRNIGHYPETVDRYLRLALKAQGQCRATLETLAIIKNPPVVIARQANIANGPQQVNNNAHTKPNANFQTSTPAHAHAENSNSVQNKLLEDRHDEGLDIRAPSAAVTSDPAMATVGAIHRPTNSRRQGQGSA